jgi:hypothetical protein
VPLVDTLAGIIIRPINQTPYPAVSQIFVGIATLTLSRRWRRMAMIAVVFWR